MKEPLSSINIIALVPLRRAFLLALLLSAILLSSTRAAERTWDGSTGNWNTPINWSADTVPTSADVADISNSGTATVPVGVSGTYSFLYMARAANSRGNILINGGSLGGIGTNIGGNAGSFGTITVASGTFNAGEMRIALGTSSTGSLIVNGGQVNSGNVDLAFSISTRATLSITNGAFTGTGNLVVGNNGVGTALVNSGGNLSVSGSTVVGLVSVGSGTIAVTSGTFSTSGLTLSRGALLADNAFISSGTTIIGGSSSASISGGTWNTANLHVGTSVGSPTLAINNALVTSNASSIGGGSITVTSGTWLNTGSLSMSGINHTISADSHLTSNGGTVYNTVTVTNSTWLNTGGLSVIGNLTINNGHVSNQTSLVNDGGSVIVNNGTWANSGNLSIAQTGSGSLTINGGLVTSAEGHIVGDAPGSIVTVNSGTWNNSGGLFVGTDGPAALDINGGLVTSAGGTVALRGFSPTTVTISTGTWANSGSLIIGNGGKGYVEINAGGRLTTTSAEIGIPLTTTEGRESAVLVTGQGSTWVNSGNLTIGVEGDDNTVTIKDSALLKIGDAVGETIVINGLPRAEDNFLRIDSAYLALYGDQTAYLGSLITGGDIQIWNGSAWITATADKVQITFYTADAAGEAAALAATGYSGLGGYTVAVPEPSACALLALGLGVAAYRLIRPFARIRTPRKNTAAFRRGC